MSFTLKMISLIDKLHLQHFFMEKDNKVMLNLTFNPEHIEEMIDEYLKVNGKNYRPNQFEIDIIKDLEKESVI